MSHRPFKDHIYSQFARIGRGLASEKRLELLDLLAQTPRHVEALAAETDMSVASVSQHLQALRNARLVETQRAGTRTIYRLASPQVLRLWLTLRSVAEERLAEVPRISEEFAVKQPEGDLSRDELDRLLKEGAVFLLDVRPRLEFAHGHLPGATNIPVEELTERLQEVPRDRQVVTYCRGAYCLFADEAAAFLRERGFSVRRLEGGWPEWWADGRPVAAGE